MIKENRWKLKWHGVYSVTGSKLTATLQQFCMHRASQSKNWKTRACCEGFSTLTHQTVVIHNSDFFSSLWFRVIQQIWHLATSVFHYLTNSQQPPAAGPQLRGWLPAAVLSASQVQMGGHPLLQQVLFCFIFAFKEAWCPIEQATQELPLVRRSADFLHSSIHTIMGLCLQL